VSLSIKIIKLLIIVLVVIGCGRKRMYDEIIRLQSSTISLPGTIIDSLNCNWIIVNYIDSTGCASCKLHIEEWEDFSKELESIGCVAKILFIVHPSILSETQYLISTFVQSTKMLVTCDSGQWAKENNIPDNPLLHTFLVNHEGKVAVVGSPILSPKVKTIFLKNIESN